MVAGFDNLYGWTETFPVNLKIGFLIVIVLGYALGSWALIENRFFSGVVRIQTDRGYQVVTKGPYRFIRHPGYAGAFLAYLATPMLLNSLWALIPPLMLIVIPGLQTSLEDKTLQAELPGYAEHTRRTRDRSFPGICSICFSRLNHQDMHGCVCVAGY